MSHMSAEVGTDMKRLLKCSVLSLNKTDTHLENLQDFSDVS